MSDTIPFFTPANVNPATYRMKLQLDGMKLVNMMSIEWSYTGRFPLQVLQIKGDYDCLELSSPKDYRSERNGGLTLITLDKPLCSGESVIINLMITSQIVVSPFCDRDGSVLTPQHDSGGEWYPYLAWDIPITGHFHVEIDDPEEYLLCGTGTRIGNVFQQDHALIFGLLLCRGLEYAEQKIGEVTVKAYYQKENQAAAQILMDASADVIAFYNELLGFYPQKSYSFLPYSSVSDGGGCWATGIAHFHRMHQFNNLAKGARPWIAAHEVAHHYWGCYVLDGDYPGWLSLGLGILMDEEYSISRNIPLDDGIRVGASRVIDYHRRGGNTTIWRSVEEIDKAEKENGDYHSIVSHDKTFCVMHMLKLVLGKELLFDVMRHILREYAGRPLRTMDFWRICEEFSGIQLDWLFIDCLHSNRIPGYEIESVTSEGAGAKVVIKSTGGFKFPIIVEARHTDGTVERKQLSRLMEKQAIFFDASPDCLSIHLDTDERLLIMPPPSQQ